LNHAAEDTGPGLIVPGRISIPFSYAAGQTASRFLIELRDHCRIFGTRCPECGRVLVPPPKTCPACLVDTDQWVEVGPRGRLGSHAIIHGPRAYQPAMDPLIYGLIRLDGADNNFVHLIRTDRPQDLGAGTEVEAVFAEDRRGHILDISHFRPV
jgi:uncharacterized OB-fold protein